jgi:hypothetical protein
VGEKAKGMNGECLYMKGDGECCREIDSTVEKDYTYTIFASKKKTNTKENFP